MRVPFALAMFLAAGLLFLIQPMSGKTILPEAGGSPAVWTACLLFFQAVLLAGYLYAHALRRLPLVRQVLVHLNGLAICGLLPWLTAIIGEPPDAWFESMPALAVLARLTLLTLGPALALSCTAPLLQRWFASATNANPYPLYAASNAGSLLGLVSYPFLIEPNLPLDRQWSLLRIGFAVAAAAILFAGFLAARHRNDAAPETQDNSPRPVSPVVWLLLAALPSSLLSSVTSHLTTDIAPVPLLWIGPLALYLISFILVFGRWPARLHRLLGRITPMALTFVAIAIMTRATEPVVLVGTIHVGGMFLVALLCHGELVRLKPAGHDLTRFYLWMAAGGVLGGLVNALIAPVLFSRLGTIEYPLAIVLAGLVRPPLADGSRPRWLGMSDLVWLLLLAGITIGLVRLVPAYFPAPLVDDPDAMIGRLIRYGLTAGIPAAMAFALVWRPGRFALALAILLIAATFDPDRGTRLLTMRNTLGTLHVTTSADGEFTQLTHGTTLHGQQHRNIAGPPKPLMYYYPTGPAGRLLNAMPADRRMRIGAVGLGCGALAGYGRPGEQWTFFELDSNVIRIAQDARYFSFLSTCPADVRIVTGDARRKLIAEPDGSFDLLILDAFNSDAVPTHLLTREAFDLYFRKCSPRGVLLIHASNRYLDLPGTIARTAASLDPNLVVRIDVDQANDDARRDGKFASTWLVVARNDRDLEPIRKDVRWQIPRPIPGPIWTDQFTDLLGAWKQDEH